MHVNVADVDKGKLQIKGEMLCMRILAFFSYFFCARTVALCLELSAVEFLLLDHEFDWSKNVALLECSSFLHETCNAQPWFEIFFIFTPTWGRFPF